MLLKGYSHPQTASGALSIVQSPPWLFSMDCLTFDYHIEPHLLAEFLPSGLSACSIDPGKVQIAFCDGSCVSLADEDQAWTAPHDVNYREFLLKLSCQYEGLPGWYVPLGLVTNEVSLVRGIFMGFSKRLANVGMTNFHRMGKSFEGRRLGGRVGANVRSEHGFELSAFQVCHDELVGRREDLARTFFMNRIIPAIGSEAEITNLVQLEVREAVIGPIWAGDGIISSQSLGEFESLKSPTSTVMAKSFSTAFEVVGIKEL